jgi:hypothetical protein
MSCSRGKASPNDVTKLRLFADSGGYCQNPACLRQLFVDEPGKTIHIAEMAHIFAASDTGPRARVDLTEEERGAFKNLILLCPSCHTLIDKAPDAYPDAKILEWKRAHYEKIARAFGAVEYQDRASARRAVEPLLTANRGIFDQFGPHNEYRENPESELAEVWQRKMLSHILPNNRKILAIADANRTLLDAEEHRTVERFRQHVDDLEQRHLGSGGAVGSTFPSEMADIFED